MNFEILDISGDAGIRAYGNNIGELFMNAALGMYSLVTDLDAINERKAVSVQAEGSSAEGLLVSWLNELIFRFDTYGFIGKKILIDEFFPDEDSITGGEQDFRITSSVAGEEFDPERHEGRLLIKAATYHRLKVEKEGGVWRTEVIFDI